MLQEDAELASRLRELRAYIDDLELEFSQRAAEFEKSHHRDHQGSNSGIDWIRFHCHMTSNAPADRIAVGNADLAESHQAMRAGDIGFAHLTVMARTANAVGVAFDERSLLKLARENSPGKFHYTCLHYRHAVSARAYGEEQDELTQASYLHLNTQEDVCLSVVGMLDPVGGAALRTALEPLARRSGAHDHRTRPKRDCSVTRVLLSQESVTIDVGRSKRVVSGALRKALRTRDGHCQWPGCDRTASLCRGHHLVHWIDGGETVLGSLVVLCLRHHRMVHEGGWQIVKCEEGHILTIALPSPSV